MEFKLFFKKSLKACLPYGLLFLYKKFSRKLKIDVHNIKALSSCSGEQPQFIVTLTSYGKRVNGKAPYAIRSLFCQTVQPDKIVLWLAHGTYIPKSLKNLQRFGLEILFCEDLKSYKKLLPALQTFPDDVLITADDDIYYPPEWFKMLKVSYLNDPKKIHCHRAHEIMLDEHKNIIPYTEWRHCVNTIEYQKRIFPTGGAGAIYPPHSLSPDVIDIEKINKLCPYGDDIWFWAMAKLKGTGYTIIKNCIREIQGIGIDNDGLWKINVVNKKNDEQIQNIIKEYPSVYENIL
jgi:hypothetical protein